ncbi:cytochrome P450 2J6-like [Amblyomma americanum]
MLSVLLKCLVTGVVAGMMAVLFQHICNWLKKSLRHDLPPGPRGVPFLGNLPFMFNNGYREVEALRQKYGNVFGLMLGSRYLVFLCDFDSVTEALSQGPLLNRPEEFPLNITGNPQSVILINGHLWKEQRRFMLKTFSKIGAGKEAMEQRIHEELSHLLPELASCSGRRVIPTAVITPSTSNIMTTLLVGRRFEYDDPDCADMNSMVDVIPALSAQALAVNFFPWLRKLLSWSRLGPWPRLYDVIIRRDRFCESLLEAHEKTHHDGVVKDYIDGFLREMKRQNGHGTFTRKLLIGNLSSFFGGGSGTMRTTLEWLMLTCAAKPHLQRRIQAEIDAILKSSGGKSHVPWRDRDRLPYTQAFMWETTRCKPVNPLGLMRSTTDDVIVCGYVIPRGSIVIPSLWSIFQDQSFWGDPEVFRPERFLADDGTRARKPERLIPFSYGRRRCPGESIASMVVFSYFTTILQHFNIEKPAEQETSGEEFGLSLRPTHQQVVFRLREVRV